MNQKNFMKKILSLLIVCSFLFTLLPASSANAASYENWKQYDSRWGSLSLGYAFNMADSGCKITSIAILIAHSGAMSESNFNPGTLRNKLEEMGRITYSSNSYDDGNIASESIKSDLGFNFEYVGCYDVSGYSASSKYEKIANLVNQGYYVEVRVNQSTHSVAVKSATSSNVTIMDPGYEKTNLNQYDSSGIYYLNYYRRLNATDNITSNGLNYPSTLRVGQTFSITGTITSGVSNLTNVTAGVYTSSGTLKTGRSINPGSRTCNLSSLDPYVYFNNLSAGTYYYKVTATNATGTKQLMNRAFTVTSTTDTLTLTNYNTPSDIKKGSYFSIKGTITSGSSNITYVNCGVFNSAGSRVTGLSVAPNTRTYNLANIDPYVYFNNLSAGTYYYKVIAKNSAGQKTLVSKSFKVYA